MSKKKRTISKQDEAVVDKALQRIKEIPKLEAGRSPDERRSDRSRQVRTARAGTVSRSTRELYQNIIRSTPSRPDTLFVPSNSPLLQNQAIPPEEGGQSRDRRLGYTAPTYEPLFVDTHLMSEQMIAVPSTEVRWQYDPSGVEEMVLSSPSQIITERRMTLTEFNLEQTLTERLRVLFPNYGGRDIEGVMRVLRTHNVTRIGTNNSDSCVCVERNGLSYEVPLATLTRVVNDYIVGRVPEILWALFPYHTAMPACGF